MKLLLTLLMMFTFQSHRNDCGVASSMMVAKYYGAEMPYQSSGDWHYEYTQDKDWRLFPADIQALLAEVGIDSEIDWNREYIDEAMNGEFPMIYLLEDEAHWVVIYDGWLLDPIWGMMPAKELPWGFGIRPIGEKHERYNLIFD